MLLLVGLSILSLGATVGFAAGVAALYRGLTLKILVGVFGNLTFMVVTISLSMGLAVPLAGAMFLITVVYWLCVILFALFPGALRS